MANIANVTIASDATVKVGGKLFKLDDAVQHGAAVYKTLYDCQATMLGHYRELGEILLGLQSLFCNNDKAYGKYLAGSALGAMSRQDRSDAMFIATDWIKVQKLNKAGVLDTLGVNAIRKRLKVAEGKGAGVRKEDQKSAAPKGEGKDEAVIAPKVQTEEELAAHVMAMLKNNGLDFTKFAKALATLRKGA